MAHPVCQELIREIIGGQYRELNELISKYRLLPNTVCLFDACFRHYLALKVKALPHEYFQFGHIETHTNGLHPEMLTRVENFKIDALLCLRVAMKHEDYQVDMYKDFIIKETKANTHTRVCPY